jgi:predicted ATPase
MWDKVALTDSEDDVIQALQIAAPDITDVTLVGKGGRTAIARSSKFSHPVMLKSFGDGVNRLFALSLSLINAKNGFLVVDEVENGLHHTVMVKLWRIFFKMARKLNVQIFASSHSWDCIEAFQEAAAEDPEEGALVRLTAYEDCIYPTVFSEHDLEIATRQRIEVR